MLTPPYMQFQPKTTFDTYISPISDVSIPGVILLCFIICHPRWICASIHQMEIVYSVPYAVSVCLPARCLPTFCSAVDDERAENEVCSRFLMILFMVFVLSYERCNNNSHTRIFSAREHTHTPREPKHIYLQFSSFDFRPFRINFRPCVDINCSSLQASPSPNHMCCMNI